MTLAGYPTKNLSLSLRATAELELRKRRRKQAEDAARAERSEALREKAGRLRDFIRGGWHVLEPHTPYKHGWHIDAICEHLEAVTDGQFQRLLINMPPRHSKSLSVSVFWPVWAWTFRPESRWIFASYAQALAVRDSLKCRRLIQSAWFQERWGEVFTLTGDQNEKMRFENNCTGYRIATSVGGVGTGEGGDVIVVDDAHKVDEAESDAMRSAVIEWWDGSMSTRLNNQDTGAHVIVMQRIHEDDLSGHVLAQGGYEHLCLPAEFDPARAYVTSVGSDPRTAPGELLWPERFNRDALSELKKRLGSLRAAGQLQQSPVPAEGGLFKRHWFEIVEAAPEEAKRVRSWDFAATEKRVREDSDRTCGLRLSRISSGVLYVEHVVLGQLSAFAVEELLRQTAVSDGPAVKISIPQDPGQAGKAQAEYLIRQLAGYNIAASPETGSKEERAQASVAQAEAGNIKLVRGDWNEAFLDEVSIFPNGQHDDQVDALSRAFHALVRVSRAFFEEVSW